MMGSLETTESRAAIRGFSASIRERLAGAEALFVPGGGKMFGCLLAEDGAGRLHTSFAYSGMLFGRWAQPGFAEPLFDVDRWRALEARHDPQIKAASSREERAQRSRELMARYHALYEIAAPGGGVRRMIDVIPGRPGSGMGDCCAPKLLSAANRLGLRPLGMAEMFVGRGRTRQVRQHGHFYRPCTRLCGPLMPYLLGVNPPETT